MAQQDTYYSQYCPNCGSPVKEGPAGGFVCHLCFYVKEAPGEEARRQAVKMRRREKNKAARELRAEQLDAERRHLRAP